MSDDDTKTANAVKTAILGTIARPALVIVDRPAPKEDLPDEIAIELGPVEKIKRPARVLVDRPASKEDLHDEIVIELGPVENRCGICGETFEIAKDDPHWSTGRGPICPRPRGGR